jgi:hypothetical protein
VDLVAVAAVAVVAVVAAVPKLGLAAVKTQVLQRAGYAVPGLHKEEAPCWLEV